MILEGQLTPLERGDEHRLWAYRVGALESSPGRKQSVCSSLGEAIDGRRGLPSLSLPNAKLKPFWIQARQERDEVVYELHGREVEDETLDLDGANPIGAEEQAERELALVLKTCNQMQLRGKKKI